MNSLFEDLVIGGDILEVTVDIDDTVKNIAQANDYDFNGTSTFKVPSFIKPIDYNIGVIMGPSGTGKSSLLKHFGHQLSFKPNPKKAISSQIDPNLLMKMGLSTIPSLCRPYHVLSNGEKHRCDLAYTLEHDGLVFDEFTSTVHRQLAMAISISLSKYVKSNNLKLTLATCHEDVINWLEPDWVFNTITGQLTKRRLERQALQFEINACSTKAWKYFKDFHYLTSEIHQSAQCWIMHYNGDFVGFNSAIPFPNKYLKNAYREHRLVIHPNYQGLGLGKFFTEHIGDLYVKNGYRYYSKTSHPKLGNYRDNSKKWRPTIENKKDRSKNYLKQLSKKSTHRSLVDYKAHANRLCFSHEYIGL